MKKFLLVWACLLLPFVVHAYDFKVDGIYYDITSDSTVAVTYHLYYIDYSGDIVIPATVPYNSQTYSVTSIGGSAFRGCTGMTSVFIPNSVTSIGGSAFSYCTGLTSIIVESGNTVYDSRDNCNCIIETASNTLIAGCKTSTIPNSITSIGDNAFMGCTGLTSVTIPSSVTSIGDEAFLNCTELTGITIPNSVTSIGDQAFFRCKELTGITIPNSVTSIGSYTFSDCTGLTSITIPNSVTSIGVKAFLGCSGLISVTIGSSVTSIGGYAFSGCTNVKELIYADGCTTALQTGLTSITSVTIPNSVTSIGSYAFTGCTGLTSITIPNSVTSIGNEAFSDCTGLTGVYVAWEKPLEIPSYVFAYVDAEACTLYVPTGTKELYQAATVWQDFGTIVEYDATAVKEIPATETTKRVAAYYDMNGQRIETPQRGIHIIRYEDGTTQKVLVK